MKNSIHTAKLWQLIILPKYSCWISMIDQKSTQKSKEHWAGYASNSIVFTGIFSEEKQKLILKVDKKGIINYIHHCFGDPR
jgi:hypothetical protein